MKDKSESGVGLYLSKAKVKAKEIYDEEGIKRAEEVLGTGIAANKKTAPELWLAPGEVFYLYLC